MYCVSKMRMQMQWHPSLASLAASLALPARATEIVLIYSRVCNVANLPLKIIKLQEETFKLKRFLRPRQVSNLGIGDSLTLTSSCTTYYPMTLKVQLQSEGKLLSSITTWSHEHYIASHMMESYYDAFHIKRHRRLLKKLMMVHVELTNSDISSKIGFEDLATIGQRWSLMPSLMLSDDMPVRSMVTSSID